MNELDSLVKDMLD